MSSSSGQPLGILKLVKSGPPGVAIVGLVPAVNIVPVGAALGTEPRARLPAQRRQREFEQYSVAHQRGYVDFITVEGVGLLLVAARFKQLADLRLHGP